jgi:hypothetical protein
MFRAIFWRLKEMRLLPSKAHLLLPISVRIIALPERENHIPPLV